MKRYALFSWSNGDGDRYSYVGRITEQELSSFKEAQYQKYFSLYIAEAEEDEMKCADELVWTLLWTGEKVAYTGKNYEYSVSAVN